MLQSWNRNLQIFWEINSQKNGKRNLRLNSAKVIKLYELKQIVRHTLSTSKYFQTVSKSVRETIEHPLKTNSENWLKINSELYYIAGVLLSILETWRGRIEMHIGPNHNPFFSIIIIFGAMWCRVGMQNFLKTFGDIIL